MEGKGWMDGWMCGRGASPKMGDLWARHQGKRETDGL